MAIPCQLIFDHFAPYTNIFDHFATFTDIFDHFDTFGDNFTHLDNPLIEQITCMRHDLTGITAQGNWVVGMVVVVLTKELRGRDIR